MKIGIIPNIAKENIVDVIERIVTLLKTENIDYIICNSMLKFKSQFGKILKDSQYEKSKNVIKDSDMVVSVGGDGTMLHTAYEVWNYSTPMLGVNIGKLGFLAEFDIESFSRFVKEIKSNNYVIDERMALAAVCNGSKEELIAINDIVIDKGQWSKMIEITIKVDENYVTTFSADGIIVATPTGSTGYSLSTGGPIVSPKADAITLSPIAPHTLTIRPLVLSSHQNVLLFVKSPLDKIRISLDGQRVSYFSSPLTVSIKRSEKPVKLVHSTKTDYFQILRNKLYWGLDLRTINNKKQV